MPTNLPEKKSVSGDQAWLFTKSLLFIGMGLLATFANVAFVIWASFSTYVMTGNRLYAALVAMAAFLAAQSGKAWLTTELSIRMFSKKDIDVMDQASKEKK